MGTQANRNDEMPADIDISRAIRGKFAKPAATPKVPVYPDQENQHYLAARAEAHGIDLDQLVDQLLKKEIDRIEAAG